MVAATLELLSADVLKVAKEEMQLHQHFLRQEQAEAEKMHGKNASKSFTQSVDQVILEPLIVLNEITSNFWWKLTELIPMTQSFFTKTVIMT